MKDSNNSMKDIPELLESLSHNNSVLQNHSNNNSEVKIKIDSKTSETSEDADREEMKWQNKGEHFITDIMDYCDKQSNIYNIESHKCKKKYNLYSIPTIIIPLLLAVVLPIIPNDAFLHVKKEGINLSYNSVINTGFMSFVAILNGLNTFYNFGKKSERYNEYSGKYAELSQQIAVELSKPKKFRTQLDVLTERVITKKIGLDATAPYI